MTLLDSQAGASTRSWAYETFGDLDTGDRRHRSRVLAMAATLAAHPAGEVCRVFADPAEREGAYRLLDNKDVTCAHLEEALASSTVTRCLREAESSHVFVAVDGSSLSLKDLHLRRDVGAVGPWSQKGRGVLVQTALALDDRGTPIGVCAQTYWTRSERSEAKKRKDKDKETHLFVCTIRTAFERLTQELDPSQAVFLLDRGYDAHPILSLVNQGVQMVLRAQYNRRLVDGPAGQRRYLFDALEQSRVCDRDFTVELGATSKRPARTVRTEIRVCRVTLVLRVGASRREKVTLNVVEVREVGGPAKGGLHWRLLTTQACDTREQWRAVIEAYSFRWRIEEVHRAWKDGGGHVEDMGLQKREGILKWATMHFAVAVRAVRLSRLARTQPDLEANEEFSEEELQALTLLSRRRRRKKTSTTEWTLGEAVEWVARLGGYAGSASSGGPPGPATVGRGLEKMANAAEILALLREK